MNYSPNSNYMRWAEISIFHGEGDQASGISIMVSRSFHTNGRKHAAFKFISPFVTIILVTIFDGSLKLNLSWQVKNFSLFFSSSYSKKLSFGELTSVCVTPKADCPNEEKTFVGGKSYDGPIKSQEGRHHVTSGGQSLKFSHIPSVKQPGQLGYCFWSRNRFSGQRQVLTQWIQWMLKKTPS